MKTLPGPICNAALSALENEILLFSGEGKVTYANRRAIETIGDNTVGKSVADLFDGGPERARRISQAARSSSWSPLNLTLSSGPHRGVELKLRGRGLRAEVGDGPWDDFQFMLTADPLRDRGFTQLRGLVKQLNTEIAERQRTAEELEEALANEAKLHTELIHRTKNNLALLAALIGLRIQNSKSEEVKKSLQDLEHRVNAIQAVHILLDRESSIDFVGADEVIRQLCTQLSQSICPPNVEIDTNLADITLHVQDATPLSLLVNELITNALKHAFDGEDGLVHIDLKMNGVDKLEVWIADNGRGMQDADIGRGSGSSIVQALANQLHGELERHKTDKGTAWSFIFPPSIRPNETPREKG